MRFRLRDFGLRSLPSSTAHDVAHRSEAIAWSRRGKRVRPGLRAGTPFPFTELPGSSACHSGQDQTTAIEPPSPVEKQHLPVQSESSAVQLSKSPSSCQIQRKVVEFSRAVAEFTRSAVEFTCTVVKILVQLPNTPSSCRIHAKVISSSDSRKGVEMWCADPAKRASAGGLEPRKLFGAERVNRVPNLIVTTLR